MIRYFLRPPVAMLIRFVVTRPRVKAAVRRTINRLPIVAKLVRRLTGQSSYQHSAPVKRYAPGAMTPRAKRIYWDLKKAKLARPD